MCEFFGLLINFVEVEFEFVWVDWVVWMVELCWVGLLVDGVEFDLEEVVLVFYCYLG